MEQPVEAVQSVSDFGAAGLLGISNFRNRDGFTFS
jgi:hypothetical protein